MTKEELKKELEKLKDFKLYVFEWNVYVKAEDYKEVAIENKKLKEELETATKCSSQEEWKLRNLEKENKNLKEIIRKAKEFEYDEDGMDYIYQNTEDIK
jgi:hypothetical protein